MLANPIICMCRTGGVECWPVSHSQETVERGLKPSFSYSKAVFSNLFLAFWLRLSVKLCFSNICVYQPLLKDSSEYRLRGSIPIPGTVCLAWGLGICISIKFLAATCRGPHFETQFSTAVAFHPSWL